ncbi:hypothetical protein EDD16DRAFT_1181864 [Pisolithus croceorrhizus]|nr:hypothetical protein EDD16DRAFT_1181864 [Pisolithus croceorrhizus]
MIILRPSVVSLLLMTGLDASVDTCGYALRFHRVATFVLSFWDCNSDCQSSSFCLTTSLIMTPESLYVATHSLSGGDPTACQLVLPIIYAIGGLASHVCHANNLQFGVVFTP